MKKIEKIEKLEQIYEEAHKNVRFACYDELKEIGKELKALGWDGKPLYPFSKEDCLEEYKYEMRDSIDDEDEDEVQYLENLKVEDLEFSVYWEYINEYAEYFITYDYRSFCGFEFFITECGEIYCTKVSPYIWDLDVDDTYEDAYVSIDISKTDPSTIINIIKLAWWKINKLKQEKATHKD